MAVCDKTPRRSWELAPKNELVRRIEDEGQIQALDQVGFYNPVKVNYIYPCCIGQTPQFIPAL